MAQVLARSFRRDAPGLIFNRWPTHIILIRGPLTPGRSAGELEVALAGWPRGELLELGFEDTSRPRDQFAPRAEHIAQITSFAGTMSDQSRLLTMCPGGYSRSTAAAFAARVVLGSTPSRALQQTVEDCPRAVPNRLMVALTDITLGCSGRLWQVFADWTFTTSGVRVDCPIPLRGKRATRSRKGASAR